MRPEEIPSDRIVAGRVVAPPSKSVTHRVLLLALLSGRSVEVERPLVSEDTDRLLQALRACGSGVEIGARSLVVTPGESPAGPVEIDCGASGTLLRLLVGVLSTRPGRWVLDGTSRLRERPLGPLVEALRGLGADIRFSDQEGFAPLEIRGVALPGGRAELDAGSSSQFLSAAVLAGVTATAAVEIRARRLVSAPYVDLTLDYVSRFGGRVEVAGDTYRVEPGLRPPGRVLVEGDYSAAAYFAAAAALTGGEVLLGGLDPRSSQGDRRFLELLTRSGASIESRGDGIRVSGGSKLVAVDADMSGMPDQVPTLAAMAPFAHGVTRIRGAAHLRLKESDRLAAMTRELTRVGAEAIEVADGLEIPGLWADRAPPTSPARVSPHDDHRIAMSMAVLGLRRPGLRIENPEVVAKSYPDFWEDLAGVLGG